VQYNGIMPRKQFKRVIRPSHLTPAEAARDNELRSQIMQEYPSRDELDRWIEEDSDRLAKLSDDEVLAMADSMMPQAQSDRLSVLLDKNREGQFEPGERQELNELMAVYRDGMLKKASGWAEAVRRRLRESPCKNR
jgi:hypothetical protein